MLVVFGLIAISILGVSNLPLLALFSVIVAFGSSTQDIAIDAYRIEAIEEEYQGAMSASYIPDIGLLSDRRERCFLCRQFYRLVERLPCHGCPYVCWLRGCDAGQRATLVAAGSDSGDR